jgi:hypothetical protein
MINMAIGSIRVIPVAIRLTGINLEAPGAAAIEAVEEKDQT